MPHARKFKRCKRYNEPGQAHFLTFTCFRGLPYLSRDRTRLWMVEAIASACARHAFHLWAWVIMPEHVHLLVWPTQPAYDISLFLKSLKKPVTKKARLFVRRQAPQWMAKMSEVQPSGTIRATFGIGSTTCTTIQSSVAYAREQRIGCGPARRIFSCCGQASWSLIRKQCRAI
jgi:putative transposase